MILKRKPGERKVKKQVHSFLAIIILSCFLLTPSVVFGVGEEDLITKDFSKNSDIELVQHDVHVDEVETEPIDTSAVKKNVVPDVSKEGKKVIGLFLKTMVGVGFCAVLLYIILFFAKKYYFKNYSPDDDSEELEHLDLSTPNNRNDALKSFLNRTK